MATPESIRIRVTLDFILAIDGSTIPQVNINDLIEYGIVKTIPRARFIEAGARIDIRRLGDRKGVINGR